MPAEMSVRESFVAMFGESEAVTMEAAAREHKNGIHDITGSDPFKWAVLICIGYECFTRASFREHHGFTASADAIKTWAQNHGQLNTHDGDVDYLSLFCGRYQEYMPDEPAVVAN